MGTNEFRDILRFLAMDNPPLLEDGSVASNLVATTSDKLQIAPPPSSKSKKRKFVEVPALPAFTQTSPTISMTGVTSSSPVVPMALKDLDATNLFEIGTINHRNAHPSTRYTICKLGGPALRSVVYIYIYT